MANQYDMQPIKYDMSDLERHSTYDQFLSLRDTLVFSEKKYVWKAWCKLVVWDKEKTIEILWNNIFKQNFENIEDWWRKDTILWPYVKRDYATATQSPFNSPISCVIQKDWWYHLKYKIEVLPTAIQKKVYTYFDIYRIHDVTVTPLTYDLISWWGIAVFDMQGEVEKTCYGSTSWTDPNGSCMVTVRFVLWELIQKVTAMWDMEMNLQKWDVVVLRAKDAERWSWPTPLWNNLTFQSSSNYWSIEYLNLPINS